MKPLEPGDNVQVRYDGKRGRGVPGEVLDVAHNKILVRFDEWAGDEKGIEHWFPLDANGDYGGYVPVKDSLIKILFGAKGDWYSVVPSDTGRDEG